MQYLMQSVQNAKSLEEYISVLKSEFASSYIKKAHLYEALPNDASGIPDISQKDLDALHKFIKSNPIYENSYESIIAETCCTVYEGDMNSYWLDSIKHDASYALFYPTWVISACALIKAADAMGIKHVVDIGSGDGRIAYCSSIAGIETYSVEIDENLAALQKKICSDTGVRFEIKCGDATQMNYPIFDQAVFFIGSIPEIGEMLAKGVIKKTLQSSNQVYVLSGTQIMRKNGRNASVYGWGPLLEEFDLKPVKTLILPTRWTVEHPEDTPYVFAVKNE